VEIVELRVHGVHGTSPGAMLGVSDGEAGQVAGDKLTGLYRSKDGKVPYRRFGGTPVSVEAYSWGALTSGVQGFFGWVKRALWLLLLPFALANLAYWARLEIGKATGKGLWGASAVRASSILLTVFLVLSPCVIAIDMIGWQCYRYGVPGCTHVPGQLDFMATLSATQRLAITTLAPMLLIGLLWLLSRASLSRYEETPVPEQAPDDATTRFPILRNPDLWRGKARTLRLQRLHLAAAIATVCAFSGLHVWHAKGGGSFLLGLTTVAACLVLLAAIALSTLSHPADLESPPPEPPSPDDKPEPPFQRPLREHAGWLTLLALAVYLVHVAALLWDAGTPAQSGDFFGHNVWFITVFVLLTALTLAVFTGSRMPGPVAAAIVAVLLVGAVAAAILHGNDRFDGWVLWVAVALSLVYVGCLDVWHYRVRDQPGNAWRGASAAFFLGAAAWVGLLFTSSAVIASADYLNGPDHSVGDLVSKTPASNASYDREYVASGKVQVRNANIVVAHLAKGGKTVTVHSGTVTMDGLSLRVTGEQLVDAGFSVGRGTTTLVSRSSLKLPAGSFDYEDSCVMPAAQPGLAKLLGQRCTAEQDAFRAGGVIDVAKQILVVQPHPDAGDDTVVLASTNPPQQPLVVPQVLIWTPIGQLVWLAAVFLALLVCVLLYWFTAGRRIVDFLPDEQGTVSPDNQIHPRDRAACKGKRRVAGLAHRAERLLDLVGAITMPVGLLVIVFSATGKAPWELYEGLRPFATISMYAVLGMSLALVALGSQLRRSESARKAIGVIWDLTTFWPRAAHPLAPPCYAERVVPELQIRTQWALAADGDNRVILSGHSQGSLIVAAMASRLSNPELGRVRVITYGSQIRALYGRVFPGVFGPEDIGYTATTGVTALQDPAPDVPNGPPANPAAAQAGSLRERLTTNGGSWVNLFRRTDPLGFRVFSDLDSELDVPVAEVPNRKLGDPGPVVMTHSGYQHTLAYRTTVASWTNEIVVPDPPGTIDLPTLPPL
jgi:hypothetical protein